MCQMSATGRHCHSLAVASCSPITLTSACCLFDRVIATFYPSEEEHVNPYSQDTFSRGKTITQGNHNQDECCCFFLRFAFSLAMRCLLELRDKRERIRR